MVTIKRFAYTDYEQADSLRLMRILILKGYDCRPRQARKLWKKYSESMCAGWVNMDDDDDETIFALVKPYINP